MMIIRVDPKRTAKTCVKLVDLCGAQVIPMTDDGCGDLKLDAHCDVYRAGCHETRPRQRVWCQCRYVEQDEPEETRQGVRYPAFELDQDGRLCFYWDQLLLGQQAGRYDVEIYIKADKVSAFQIDLRSAIRVEEIVNVAARDCANC